MHEHVQGTCINTSSLKFVVIFTLHIQNLQKYNIETFWSSQQNNEFRITRRLNDVSKIQLKRTKHHLTTRDFHVYTYSLCIKQHTRTRTYKQYVVYTTIIEFQLSESESKILIHETKSSFYPWKIEIWRWGVYSKRTEVATSYHADATESNLDHTSHRPWPLISS